jgi:hypothetical protein
MAPWMRLISMTPQSSLRAHGGEAVDEPHQLTAVVAYGHYRPAPPTCRSLHADLVEALLPQLESAKSQNAFFWLCSAFSRVT